MSLLVETIRIEEGIAVNISFHNERMMKTMRDLFSISMQADLLNILEVPVNARKGIFRCRVEYDTEVRKIEFLPYNIKSVKTLKLVEDNNISYPYKYTDRKRIEELMERRGGCDDILIIRNKMITDTSYANVVFRDFNGKWFTPSSFLLSGTRRAFLLRSGLIGEVPIRVEELGHFSELKLINSMIGMDDMEAIPISKISF